MRLYSPVHWNADAHTHTHTGSHTRAHTHKHKAGTKPAWTWTAAATTVCLFLRGWPVPMGGLSKPFLIHLISWTQEPGPQTKSSFTHAAAAYSYMWSQESVHHQNILLHTTSPSPGCLRFPPLFQLIRPLRCWYDRRVPVATFLLVLNHNRNSVYSEARRGTVGTRRFQIIAWRLIKDFPDCTWKDWRASSRNCRPLTFNYASWRHFLLTLTITVLRSSPNCTAASRMTVPNLSSALFSHCGYDFTLRPTGDWPPGRSCQLCDHTLTLKLSPRLNGSFCHQIRFLLPRKHLSTLSVLPTKLYENNKKKSVFF